MPNIKLATFASRSKWIGQTFSWQSTQYHSHRHSAVNPFWVPAGFIPEPPTHFSLCQTMASNDSTLDHPFLSYLTALLSIYELGPDSRTLPPYDGPSDLQTDAIIGSLTSIVKRMYQAEPRERNEVQEVSLFMVFTVWPRFTMVSRLLLSYPRHRAPEVFVKSTSVPP